MLNVEQTIISQYGNSRTIVQLIQNMNEYIDPRADIDAFYDAIWNIDTATGYGLDCWGKIVGVERELILPETPVVLGFNEATGYQPFGRAPFYSGEASTNAYRLTNDAYRVLILVKALANISRMTAPSLNQILQNLFAGRGRCYVRDIGGMQMMFIFEFALLPYETAILTQSNAVPRPAAVKAQILQCAPTGTFGFREAANYQPFGHGTFFNPFIGLLDAA